MSYRCEVCLGSEKPGRTRKVHVIYRTVAARIHHVRVKEEFRTSFRTVCEPRRTEIAREVSLCHACYEAMEKRGLTFEDLLKERGRAKASPLLVRLLQMGRPVQGGQRMTVHDGSKISVSNNKEHTCQR
jgi:hypothetical protein